MLLAATFAIVTLVGLASLGFGGWTLRAEPARMMSEPRATATAMSAAGNEFAPATAGEIAPGPDSQRGGSLEDVVVDSREGSEPRGNARAAVPVHSAVGFDRMGRELREVPVVHWSGVWLASERAVAGLDELRIDGQRLTGVAWRDGWLVALETPTGAPDRWLEGVLPVSRAEVFDADLGDGTLRPAGWFDGASGRLESVWPLDGRFLFDSKGSLLGIGAGRGGNVRLHPVSVDRGRSAGAIALSKLAELWQGHSDWSREWAELRFARGHWRAAIEAALDAVALEPDLERALEQLIDRALVRWFAERDPADAPATWRLLDRANSVLFHRARVQLLHGVARVEERDHESALSAFEQAMRSHDAEIARAAAAQHAHCSAWLAEAARRSGDPENAVRFAERGLQRQPNDVVLLQSLGHALFELGEFERSENELRRAASLDSEIGRTLAPILSELERLGTPLAAAEVEYREVDDAWHVEVGWNGNRALAAVDHTATRTVIALELAERSGIDVRQLEERRSVTTFGSTWSAPVLVLAELRLGGALARDLEVLVLPLDPAEPPIRLGRDFLDRFRIQVDAARGLLRLQPLTDR